MATFVLVHPAWFGSWCWRDVASTLRASGHGVCSPTLTGLGERAHLLDRNVTLSTHVEDVINAVLFEDLHDITLVGNSSGGTVITAAADRISDRVASIVYLDAFVPDDGESTKSLIAPDRWAQLQQFADSEGDGWLLPRWAPMPWETILRDVWHVTDPGTLAWVLPRLRPTPIRHFTEPVHLEHADQRSARLVYIRCRTGPAPFDKPAAVAQHSPAWTYREVPWSHVSFLTQPRDLAQILLDVGT